MVELGHWDLLGAVLLASALAVSTIPFTRRIAAKLKAVAPASPEIPSRPAVPLLAGAPIMLAIFVSLGMFSTVPVWMLIGGAGLTIVGLLDDIFVLRPGIKLVAQAIIAVAAVGRWPAPALFAPSALNSLFIVLWLLATVNAFNLIDGLDGLAGGVGIVIALAVAALGSMHHDAALVCQGLAIVGALAGFLLFNFPPASIFMGDCGALPLGFMLGAIALNTAQAAATSALTLYTLPVLLMLVPLLDMGVVSISRMASNQPVTGRGHDHSHHKLLALGLPDRTASEACWVVAALAGLCAIALASMTYAHAVIALPLIAAVFGLIAFFMIDLSFESAAQGVTYSEMRGVQRLLLNFGYKRRVTEVLLDLALISAAYLGAFLIRLDFVIDEREIESIVSNLPYVMAGSLIALFVTGIYRGIWRYAGLTDLPRFAYAAIAAGVVLVVEAYSIRVMLSGSIAVLFVMLLFYLLAGSRLSFKGFRVVIAMVAPLNRRVLVVGAGATGEAAVRYLSTGRNGVKVVGLLDSDPFKIGSLVYGSVVLGSVAKLAEVHARTRFNEILLACDQIAPDELKGLLEFTGARRMPLLRFSIEVNEIAQPLPLPTAPVEGGVASLQSIVSPGKVVA